MTDLEAIDIIEVQTDVSREKEIEAWQHLVDSGLVWQLQGFYGRTASALIKDGTLAPRELDAR